MSASRNQRGTWSRCSLNEGEKPVDISEPSEEQAVQNAISRISPSVGGNRRELYGETTATYQEKYAEGIASWDWNYHHLRRRNPDQCTVVKDLTSMIVILQDGSGYEGRVKYLTRSLDLAVIKIDKLGLPVAAFADESAMVTGARVLAVGTPVNLGLRNPSPLASSAA